MFPSIRIGSVFGITIKMHWLFLVMVLFLLSRGDPAWNALFIGLLFGSVFLHELGHSLVAQHFGIKVVDIVFWPLGGMARMSHVPEDSRVEGFVAIAGPAVNMVLAGLAFALWIPLRQTGLGMPLLIFIQMNLLLGFFNLIPAFPMDGGRILRALLGLRLPWLRATEIAVRVGKYSAILMILAALFFRLPFVALIAVFVWFAGVKELVAMRFRHAQRQFEGFAEQAAGATGSPFGPHASWASWAGTEPPPRDDAPHGPRRPVVEGLEDLGRGGISDADVERLERFRGRLGKH